jgi:alkaline phosphatase D
MIRASALAALLLVTACDAPPEAPPAAAAPVAEPAPSPPPATAPAPAAPPVPAEAAAPAAVELALPVRGEGPPLPAADAVLTRIAIGSCAEETDPMPIFAAVATARPDLFLFIGDNVYGDPRPRDPEAADPTLPRLRKAYGDLNLNAHFSAFNMAAPMLAVWDDHDYGLNDAGAEFAGRELSERIFETYWGPAALGTDHPGVYGARVWGPPGRRVQVILLDTRFFRTPLKRGGPDANNRRPYLPQTEAGASMLGEAQWRWLEAELRKPAEVRLLVSSIQVLAEGHPFESWDKMPNERRRLFDTVRRTGAKGVLLVSGDRHVAAMYSQAGLAPYPLREMTTSSLNLNFVREDLEKGPNQIGRVYTPANFGLVEIDWRARRVAMSVRAADGEAVRTLETPFRDLGL